MSDTTAPDGTAAPVPAALPSGPGDPPAAPAGPGPGGDAPDSRARYTDVFRVREFRFVFAAHVMSILGEVVAAIALTVLVYDRTGSPLLSALTLGVGLLPYLVGGTLLSAVADRLPARRVLVTCDLLAAVCFALMVLPGMPVAVLLTLRCVAGVISPVFTGTRIATLADILGTGDRFVLGRSVIRLTAQAAQLVGFALGGLLAAFSPRATLTVTALGMLGSALVLRFGTRARPARAAAGGSGGPPGRASTVGASLAAAGTFLRDRRIRALMLLTWIPPTFVVAPEALAAAYADELGIGALGLGLLMTGMPIGAVTGEILAGSLLGPRGRERIVFPVAVLCTVPAIGFVTHPSFGWALPLLVLTGFGISYSLGLDQWFVAAVPEEMRGRAMTLQTAGLMTLQGVGMGAAGAVAEFVPVHLAVAAVGTTGTLCSLLVCLEVRRTRPKRETGLTTT
jgi:MFS family permease